MPTKTNFSCLAILISLFLTLGISFYRDLNCTSSLCRGDFPAFYAAAKIVSQGKINELYSVDLQAKLEHLYWPSLRDSYLQFSYPPYVAILLSPLANFTPPVAKVIWICLSLIFLFCALRLSVEGDSNLRKNSLLIFTLLICFPSNFLAIIAGQMLALNILLFTLLAYYLSNEKPVYPRFFFGVSLGFFLFKPNFFLLLFIFLLPLFSIQLLIGLILIGSLFFLLAATGLNLFWPIAWIQEVKEFAKIESLTNGFQSISLIEVNSYFREYFGENNIYQPMILVLLSFVLLLIFINTSNSVFIFIKKKEAKKKIIIDYLILMLASACLLLNVHALFYELGILVLPALKIIFRNKTVWTRADFAKIFFFYFLVLLAIVFKEKLFIQALISLPLLLNFYLGGHFRRFFHLRKVQ